MSDLTDQPDAEPAELAASGPEPAPAGEARRGTPPRLRQVLVLGGLAAVTAGVAGWAILGGDGKPEPPPLPPGAVAVDVWAPYWTLDDTLAETEARLADVREVSPFWFGARGVDQIVVDEHADQAKTEEFLDAVGSTPAQLVPSIRDETEPGQMAAILADPDTREQHIESLLEFADELDATGLDLDYEQFAFADGRDTWATTRPDWVAFVAELAERLHAEGLTLTVSIPPVYDAEQTEASGYWVYDHGAIAAHVDALRIMAYDYSTAEAGPIAPLDWVRQAVAGVSLAVPEEHHGKLVLGVPAYGRNWVLATTGTCPSSAEQITNVSIRSVLDLAARRGGEPVYDPGYGEWTFDYDLTVTEGAVECVQSREVRWVGAEGVAARAEIGRRAGWGGVSLWALGYEDAAAWEALITTAHDPMSVTTEAP